MAVRREGGRTFVGAVLGVVAVGWGVMVAGLRTYAIATFALSRSQVENLRDLMCSFILENVGWWNTRRWHEEEHGSRTRLDSIIHFCFVTS